MIRSATTPGVARPVLRLARQAVLRQGDQLGVGPAGVQPGQGVGRVARGRLAEDLAGGAARERRLAGEDLAEDRAQREDVGPLVDPVDLAARLLGGHVGRRAHHRAGARQVRASEPLPRRGDHRLLGGSWPAARHRRRPRPAGRTLARPQSITWTSPKLPTITLDGFRSRWITPRAWA